MSKKLFLIFSLFLISILSFSQATITRTANAYVNVNSYMSLDISTNGFLDFRFNNNQELLDGITLPNKFNVSIMSNKNWLLNVSTLTSKFLAIGSQASTQMPPDILSIKKNNSSTFVPLSQNSNTVGIGYKGDNTSAGNQFKLDIKATPGYTFNGGTYAIVLIFTLSPQ